MTLRSMLVPFSGDEREMAALHYALMLCNTYETYLQCLHVTADPEQTRHMGAMMPVSVVDSIRNAVIEQTQQQTNKAHTLFSAACEQYAVPVVTDIQPYGAAWLDHMGTVDEAIASYGRLHDMLIVHRDIGKHDDYYHDALVNCLFQTGRPVIVVPDKLPQYAPQHAVIAWDGSMQSARALAVSMPLLQTMQKVTLLHVEESDQSFHMQEITPYFKLHNIMCDIYVQPMNGNAGQSLLEGMKECRGDILVMGAYSHSRLRQMIMGGATDYVLHHANCPVLMAH